MNLLRPKSRNQLAKVIAATQLQLWPELTLWDKSGTLLVGVTILRTGEEVKQRGNRSDGYPQENKTLRLCQPGIASVSQQVAARFGISQGT
jgi:hypothetical protein